VKIVKVQPSCHGEMLPWIRREERLERTERRVGEAGRDDGWTTRTFKALKNRQSPATSICVKQLRPPTLLLGRMHGVAGGGEARCRPAPPSPCKQGYHEERRSQTALSDLRPPWWRRGSGGLGRAMTPWVECQRKRQSPASTLGRVADSPGKNDTTCRRSHAALSDLRRLGGGPGSEVGAAQLLRPVSARPPWVECQRKRRSPAPTLGRTK